MTAHKHYEMIVTKAANMDLVLFRKTPTGESWEECRYDWMPTDLQDKYFLCLPRHKETCLHWLNGGEVFAQKGDINQRLQPIVNFGSGLKSYWLNSDYIIRIKPRKEKY